MTYEWRIYHLSLIGKDRKMERLIVYTIVMIGLAGLVYAEYYEFITDEYIPGLTLESGDELYMTNGGFDSLTLLDDSVAAIEGTSALEAGTGGIWFLSLAGTSHLDLSGGQVNQIDLYNGATAVLSGGAINQIKSNQQASFWDNDNGIWINTPHIQIACESGSYNYDESTGLLTGNWLIDGLAFSIQLVDVENYSPTIQNIEFIPEPATFALFAVGGILAFRNKNRQ